jgi:hypothetical protein
MKKKLIIGIIAVFAIFTACNKDETKPADAQASAKGDLENTGVAMVSEMKSLNQEPGVAATVSLLELASSSNAISMSKSAVIMNTLMAVKGISENKTTAKTLISSLKSAKASEISFLSSFEDIAGTYTYSFEGDSFVFVANPSGSVKFLFPASKASKTAKELNGVFEILRPQVKTGTFDFNGDVVTELPTSIAFDIKINNTKVLGYSFTASYTSDGIPSDVASALTLGTFLFQVSWGYHATDASVGYLFKHGATTILDLGGQVNGKLDKQTIEESFYTVSDTFGYGNNYWVETRRVSNPQNVIDNANAHFQFMDIRIEGIIDFIGLYNAMNDSISIESQADSINKYASLTVIYASSKKLLANAEAFVDVEISEYPDWDYATEQQITRIDTSENINVKMVFADNSKASIDTYFSEGFNSLITDMNSFIGELNDSYGWNMKPINNENN